MARTWAQRERGAPFMMRLMLWLALKLGRRGVRWILYPTVAYFLLAAPQARRASRRCLTHLLGRPATLRDVARHLFCFASCTQDRIFLLRQQQQELRVDAYWTPDIPAVVDTSPGCILLVGHFGSREALRLTPRPPSATTENMSSGFIHMPEANRSHLEPLDVAVLLDRGVGRQMTALFEQLNPGLAGRIIDATERGPAVVLKLKEAIAAGQMVGIGADRASDDEAAVPVRFLGGVVRLPEGPWRLAASLGVPVLLGFGQYCGGNRYEAHFELFRTRVTLSRRDRESDIAALAQAYAARLEHHARRAPYNWFNFYDYWLQEPDPPQ